MLTIICFILAGALGLVVWFQTNAFYEYARLLGLNNLPLLRQYEQMTGEVERERTLFSDWLATWHGDKFLVRLVSCDVCLSCWWGLFAASTTTSLLYTPIIAWLTLTAYRWFNSLR